MTKKKSGKTMRLAGLLLVLVLVTSCFVGGTFAKYVTSDEATDTARVAKFGVAVTANGSTFAETYATDDSTATTITDSVVSTDKVVAPGTKGDMTKMTLSGTPEVAVEVKYEATVTLNDKWVGDTSGSYYCPLIIKVGGTEIKGLDYSDATEFAAAVKTAIDGCTAKYAPGTDLSTTTVTVPSVSWEWPFETGADDNEKAENDVKDTYLGDQAVAGNAATITLEVKTTVTQIN